jgi:hypothetical protein
MPQQHTVALTGTYDNRVAQLLRAARHQARLAQAGAGPRMWDALTELDHILEDQIVAIANAAVDDKSDAELAGTWLD